MRDKSTKIFIFVISIILLFTAVHAEDPNIDGGGGGMGVGTADNMWAVKDKNGNTLYDGEGFRIYLVSGDTGAPISGSKDITNFAVSQTNMRNGRGKTKYEYKHVDSGLIPDVAYQSTQIIPPMGKLPHIIPWDESSSTARINAIKNWFLNPYYADWALAQLSSNIDEVRENGYKLAIEPIAYFRYGGYDYAFTATECALLNQMVSGDLRNKMGPLTSKNLPLSVFLEENEFESSSHPIYAWTGSRNTNAADSDIINQLGIGYISFKPGDDVPEEPDDPPPVGGTPLGGGYVFDPFDADPHTYPVNTWVITSFRLCDVRRTINGWSGGPPFTSMRPAAAYITVGGISSVTISNVYIPSGSEQLVWVKWKTPPTPCTVNITATASKGLYYNPRSTGSNDRYTSTGLVTAKIVDTLKENPPPDPTIDDTKSSIGYSETPAAQTKSKIISAGTASNSWIVWDCDYYLSRTYSRTNRSTKGFVNPPNEEYDEETGIYYVYRVTDRYTQSSHFITTFYVRYDTYVYNYKFTPINHSAQLKSGDFKISPSVHNPTDYVSGYQTFMKSGYGINAEAETYLTVSIDGSMSSYYDPSTTTYAAAPQYVVSYFPEFNYSTYNRFLEKNSSAWKFKPNVYSAYLDRSHFTPWWFPDNQKYAVAARIDFAYTPAGRLYIGKESTGIMIEGNVYDDWRVSPVFP
jgi:hypothetical protein